MATKTYKAIEVRISMQTNQNALNANPKWFTIPSATCNIKATEGAETVDVISQGAEPNATFLNGIDEVSGNIGFNLQYTLMPWLFGSAIGATTPTDAASGDWTLSTIYTVGTIVNGTNPATDDLVAYSVSGSGESDTTAPDTTAKTDRELIIDNEVEWAVRKGDLKKYDGSLQACNDFFAVEIVAESDCTAETVYFRKIGCRVGSLGLSFDKNTGVLQADINVMGTRAESNIKTDGTLDATYEDFSAITGNAEVSLEEEVYVKKGDLDFTLDGNPSEYVETFSINIENSIEAKNLLSKTADGKNAKCVYSSAKKVINGSISAMFDLEIQGSMDGVTTRQAVISADSGFGDRFSLTLPEIKLDKSEPDFNTNSLMLNPNWTAQPVEGGSALTYSTTSLSAAYK